MHTNRKYIKAVAAAAVIKKVAEEVITNRDYYTDFVKFNFMNSIKSEKRYEKVCYYDLPVNERTRIVKLYRRFSGMTIEQIYRHLNTPTSITNRTMPLETRWAYAYYKKYGSLGYRSNNQISDYEILRPLTAAEASEYAKMF